jgi:hypothetical protein
MPRYTSTHPNPAPFCQSAATTRQQLHHQCRFAQHSDPSPISAACWLPLLLLQPAKQQATTTTYSIAPMVSSQHHHPNLPEHHT